MANNISKRYSLHNGENVQFDALKNLSFSIDEGETVGIIGHNGAGKSTILKILSGITFPTSGEAKVVGSFSSLLEVGTGFHPDLTGRDNIYFNASILGVSRKSTQNEIDNIIAFSGVANFIDQPLRTYSSGMKLRLAFSIIAHLKTDIIALDEVLAVGDSMFQIKCMERIFDFKNQGRTVLFVSHNLSAVKKLCERTLVLSNGNLIFDGCTDEAIQTYLNSTNSDTSTGRILNTIDVSISKKQVNIKLSLGNLPSNIAIDLGLNITTNDGSPIYHFSNRFIDQELTPVNGKIETEILFSHQLKPGRYPVSVYVGQGNHQVLWEENASSILIPPDTPYGFHNPDAIQGPVITEFQIVQH